MSDREAWVRFMEASLVCNEYNGAVVEMGGFAGRCALLADYALAQYRDRFPVVPLIEIGRTESKP